MTFKEAWYLSCNFDITIKGGQVETRSRMVARKIKLRANLYDPIIE